jgi:hypothetical protein
MEVIHVNIQKVPNIHHIWNIFERLTAHFVSGDWYLKRRPPHQR